MNQSPLLPRPFPERTARETKSFWPPHCPQPECSQAAASVPLGFFRHGYYTARGQARRVPRFLCRFCRRTVSSQTFDETYRLRRPELEGAIIREMAQGSSVRRAAEVLGVNRKTISRRLMRARRLVHSHAGEPGSIPAIATSARLAQEGSLPEVSICAMRSRRADMTSSLRTSERSNRRFTEKRCSRE